MTLGFVGLGVMGGRMAKRLLDGGHRVIGYNRTREKARWLADAGMRVADSPREVAVQADVVFTMVTDTPALDAVCRGPDGILAGLRRGTVHVEMSTVSPEAVRAIAAEVASRGADLLDAPVSGSPVTLEAGQLSFMIGGDPATLERVRPYLAAIGPTLTHVVAVSEAVLLAEKAGIARERAVEALLRSVLASPMLKYRGPFVLGMPAEAWFDVGMMQKDLKLALDLGRATGVPLSSVAIANELLTAARGMGLGRYDFAVVFDVLATMSGQVPSHKT